MTDCAHFYHLFATPTGGWRDPLAEHLAALEDGAFDGPFHVGIVGPPDTRAEALHELNAIRPPDSATEQDDGWEQVTLKPLRVWARKHDGAVLYAHTKGAANANRINETWRRHMSWHVVRNWREHVAVLETGQVDAVGCHWLTPEQFPGVVDTPFFGGTFWLASCDYLRRLPPCPTRTRHDAEMWIGMRDPRVLDLSPGWPGNYRAEPPYRRIVAGRA